MAEVLGIVYPSWNIGCAPSLLITDTMNILICCPRSPFLPQITVEEEGFISVTSHRDLPYTTGEVKESETIETATCLYQFSMNVLSFVARYFSLLWAQSVRIIKYCGKKDEEFQHSAINLSNPVATLATL